MATNSLLMQLFGLRFRLLLTKSLNLLPLTLVSSPSGPKASKPTGILTITDSRTNRQYRIPITNNAVNAIDLGVISVEKDAYATLRANSGLKVLDPGFANTAVMTSGVTFIDGIKGEIYYRGISIDNLFGHSSFEEVAHLLIWGHLPSLEEKHSFRQNLNKGLNPPDSVIQAIDVLPRDAPPVTVILAGLAAYAASDPSTIPTAANDPHMYQGNMAVVDKGVLRTLSTMAVVISLTYCHQRNRRLMPANPEKSFIENVLIMMGFVDEQTGLPSAKTVETLDRLWILYLDHEMTNSTAALLHVASTLADPISCCIGLVASANGPLHGGAIDLAYKKFENIGTVDNVPELIKNVKAKKFRLFGYGHRIYKTVDPRAKYLRSMLDDLSQKGKNNRLLAIALEIDRVASTDAYFTSRNLKANADLYGCFVYTALSVNPRSVCLNVDADFGCDEEASSPASSRL
ncbi:MAG: hypothetical protein LQ350_006804 [Teloschistes chrysophthalmus]|nr:MAG: hypothetical protein LQ350_006804 [Niorma chrysophthalma]